MAPDRRYPYPDLVLLADTIEPGRSLPLAVTVINPGSAVLSGARGELTLEVEKGVLLTWQLAFAEVAPNSRRENAVSATEPDWRLPSNVPSGQGRLRLVLTAADGALLNEVTAELPVAGTSGDDVVQPAG